MNQYELSIGKHIKEVRKARGMSQEKLANACGFSNTTLSAYENSRKIPSLVTIAKIAKNLKVSVERLYYGDDNNAFIISEENEGRKIVNSVFFLWNAGIINYYENHFSKISINQYVQQGEPKGVYLGLLRHKFPIQRLITSLDEFNKNKETFEKPDDYLEMLLSSVAAEINREIENSERKQQVYIRR